MGDSSKLIRQLRDGEFGGWVGSEAADAIEAQAKRIAELEAALKPFADDADCYDHLTGDELVPVTVWDIRAARKVLGEKE